MTALDYLTLGLAIVSASVMGLTGLAFFALWRAGQCNRRMEERERGL